jgi:hypothetical protein
MNKEQLEHKKTGKVPVKYAFKSKQIINNKTKTKLSLTKIQVFKNRLQLSHYPMNPINGTRYCKMTVEVAPLSFDCVFLISTILCYEIHEVAKAKNF